MIPEFVAAEDRANAGSASCAAAREAKQGKPPECVAVALGLGWVVPKAGGESDKGLTEWLQRICLLWAHCKGGWLDTKGHGMPSQGKYEAAHGTAGNSCGGQKEAFTTGRCMANTKIAMQEANRVRSRIVQ